MLITIVADAASTDPLSIERLASRLDAHSSVNSSCPHKNRWQLSPAIKSICSASSAKDIAAFKSLNVSGSEHSTPLFAPIKANFRIHFSLNIALISAGRVDAILNSKKLQRLPVTNPSSPDASDNITVFFI